jgi:hypothetical protein
MMPMKKFQPTLEHGLYAFAIVLSFGMHFVKLGVLPLSEFESTWAVQSLQVANGMRPAVGSNPAYVHLTAFLFFLFNATDFLARFWPALAGSLLSLAPWFLRKRIGQIPAIIVAFGLAIDPGLAALSRLVGGPILAVACLLFAYLLWEDRKFKLAGVLIGLALLAGQSTWFGLFSLLITWAVITIFKRKPAPKVNEENDDPTREDQSHNKRAFRDFILWALGTFLLVGTLATFSFKGLPAAAMSLLEFLRGWWIASGVPIWKLLLALPAYEILPLTFGIVALIRGWMEKDRDAIRLGIWALAVLGLAIIYPGRQAGDLIWAILPMWILAAKELGKHLEFSRNQLWGIAGVMTLVMTLLVFGWLELASVTNMDLGASQARMRLYLVAAVVVLILLSLLLVRLGWSATIARFGGVWSSALMMTMFTIAMCTGAAGLREPLTVELWDPEPRTGRVDVLVKVAGDVSEINTGFRDQLPLTISGVNSPALEWLFRNWQTKHVSIIATEEKPAMIITAADQLSLEADYRGGPFPLHEAVDWNTVSMGGWLKWFIYRQLPVVHDTVILWVRSDLMLSEDRLITP